MEDRCDAPGLSRPGNITMADRPSLAWLRHALASTLEDDDGDSDWEDDPDGITEDDYGPFENCSQLRLTDWWYGQSGAKSMGDFDDLLSVLSSKGFELSHLRGFGAKKAEKMLDGFEDDNGIFSKDDGWMRSDVYLSLPKTFLSHKTESAAPQLAIPGVVHRSLLGLVKGVVTDEGAPHSVKYHWRPHQMWWYPPDHPQESVHSSATPSSDQGPHTPPDPIRVHTDCYNSDAMLEEDAKLRKQARDPTDDPSTEYCILPLLIWSDATHLSDFGHASLWPIYVYFGNLSQYIRGRPTEFAAQHLAYIPDVSASFQVLFTS